MKSFKQFIKHEENKKSNIVHEPPVHGSHAKNNLSNIVHEPPVHGKHSTPLKTPSIKEELLSTTKHARIDDVLDHLSANKKSSDFYQKSHELTAHNDISKNGPEETKYIRSYTSSSSNLNRQLIELAKKKHPSEWNEEDNSNISKKTGVNPSVLAAGIAKHKPPEPTMLFHGTSYDPEKMMKEDGPRTFIHPTFTSASISPHIAQGFARFMSLNPEHASNPDVDIRKEPTIQHMLAIHTDENTPVMHIGKNSSFPDEHESIFPHATEFSHLGHEDHEYTEPFTGQKRTLRIHHVTPIRMHSIGWESPTNN